MTESRVDATRDLLSGNEAMARGAYEAGVMVGTGYPGTPSTETLEFLATFSEVYCEWCPNEKVAVEVAAGASLVGRRALATMKHVGLNVAADPVMTLSYTGIVGGLVLVVADDPGMHSSQNEQDTRNYARFAKIPVLEPSDSQEAKDFVIAAFELSERYRTPVILRSTTRISHCRSVVKLGPRRSMEQIPRFEKDPERYVPVPAYGRRMRRTVEDRLEQLQQYAEHSPLNRVVRAEGSKGIITSSIAYQYVEEVFPDAAILKLGMAYPYPDALIRRFARKFDEVLVVEELDSFLEEHLRSLGIPVVGRARISGIGELNPDRLAAAALEPGAPETTSPPEAARAQGSELPPRPPLFCAGCPSMGLFHALARIKCVVTGDIGCYSLGVFPPYRRMDTIVCMGAGVTICQGMDKGGYRDLPLVGVVGDSTFFHSGITGLLELSYNRGNSTIIVVDNRSTAMTGHQDHPGTGRTLQGEPAYQARPEDFARACGIEHVRVIDPLDFGTTLAVLKEETARREPSLVVARRACVLQERRPGTAYVVDQERCTICGRCLRIGCPALEKRDGRIRINELACYGCGYCAQVCPQDAIAVGRA